MTILLPKHNAQKRSRILMLTVFAVTFLGISPALVNGQEIPTPSKKPQIEAEISEIPVPTTKPKSKTAIKTEAKYKIPAAREIKLSDKALTSRQAELYKEIFALQALGQMKESAEKINKLSDFRLYGYVLYQRYAHPAYGAPSYAELKDWMEHYADHPNAKKVYDLALLKKPANAENPNAPVGAQRILRRREPTMVHAAKYISERERSGEEAVKLKDLRKRIVELVLKERPTQAFQLLEKPENKKLLDDTEYDIARARIAASYLYNGKIDKALEHAKPSAERSGTKAPLAGWIAGIASWMKQDYAAAAKYFEITGRSSYASGWTRAAGSYWAARSHMRTGNVKQVDAWLGHAAQYPRTFYGLIATRAMGQEFNFNWRLPTFTKDNYKILASNPAGFRGMALVDAGQKNWAETELLHIDITQKPMRDALLSYADYARIPSLMMRLGSALSSDSLGLYYDAALYPSAPWQPESGFRIEPQLLHAIMRQESRFNPSAASPSGARGVMQIIPSTAQSVGLKSIEDLSKPATNLELGQRYLAELLGKNNVQGDVFKLLIAYNAGPGNLQKWQSRWPNVKDPLLFVELIPSAETRAYVERVLANYWIYHLREGDKVPHLDAVAAGQSEKGADKKGLRTALAQ